MEILPKVVDNNHEKLPQIFDSFTEKAKIDGMKTISVIETDSKKLELEIANKKNKIMREIIKNKDRLYFESNKTMFTSAECKYIEEHLK